MKILLMVVAVTAACGGGDSTVNDASAGDGGGDGGDDAAVSGQARGPRALPPTFVNLELGSFPRPAQQACADNTVAIEVRAGSSIAAALASAPAGSTVWVEPGTYTESAGESTALSMTTKNVCLRAADGGVVVLQAASGQGYGIAINAPDSVLEGFTLRGFNAGVGLASPARNVTVERVHVEQMTGGFRDGIVAYGAVNGLLVLDCHVDGADLGISCNTGPCSHWWVERSTVVGRATGGGDSGADAFAIENGRQIVVLHSTMAMATGDGIDTKASDVVIYGARVHDVQRNGVKLWRGGDVINTIVAGTDADASLVGDGPGRYRYLHAVVADHAPGGTGYVGTWGYDAQVAGFEVEFINSIFYNSATGGLFVPASATISMRNTILDSSSGKLIDIGPSTTYQRSELAAFEASGHGSGNIIGDPLFTNATARDFSTLGASPARDAAEVTSNLAADVDGNPRVRGTGPDIGAVESP